MISNETEHVGSARAATTLIPWLSICSTMSNLANFLRYGDGARDPSRLSATPIGSAVGTRKPEHPSVIKASCAKFERTVNPRREPS